MHKSKERLEIPPWVGIALIAVVVIVMVAPATPSVKSGLPRPSNVVTPPGQEYTTNPDATMHHIRLLARQTRGDWNLVSASDQQLMNGITGGHGRALLRMTAEKQAVDGRQ